MRQRLCRSGGSGRRASSEFLFEEHEQRKIMGQYNHKKYPEIDLSKPAKTPEQALESLMLTCARMERCVSDVRRSLYRWRIAPEDHGTVIERLIREKFVDEERYARSYVREKMSLGTWGRKKIETGLRAKGIPSDVIDQAMEQLDSGDQNRRLEEMLRKRYEKERGKAEDGYQLRARLIRWVASRGYDYEDIQDTLKRIIKEDEETYDL